MNADLSFLHEPRITLITGHYGTGKTNVAVNLALALRRELSPLALADLDIVNPYFRSADAHQVLEDAGIEVILPAYANTNVDLPSLPARVASVFDRGDLHAVLDVGGDDAGATALGQYASRLEACGYRMLAVINARRPEIARPEDAVAMLRSIEQASRLKVTGLINNTHLCEETTPQVVESSFQYAAECARISGVPVVLTTAEERIAAQLQCPDLLPIRLYTKNYLERF